MPFSPRKCIGKNVTLKPAKMTQKDRWPQSSLTWRPTIRGNQYWMPASSAKIEPPIST